MECQREKEEGRHGNNGRATRYTTVSAGKSARTKVKTQWGRMSQARRPVSATERSLANLRLRVCFTRCFYCAFREQFKSVSHISPSWGIKTSNHSESILEIFLPRSLIFHSWQYFFLFNPGVRF